MADPNQLVHGVEVWLPDGKQLVLAARATLPAVNHEPPRPTRHFRYGEGLVGAAWASRRALIWSDREVLGALASGAVHLGLPCFQGQRLTGVVSLALHAPATGIGCFELWRPVEALGALRHEAGHYPALGEFERLSLLLQFPRGSGLPGKTWESGDCEVIVDVTRSDAFLRADLAARARLAAGIGLPIYSDEGITQVLTMLAGSEHSFVSAVDSFVSDADRATSTTWLFDSARARGAPRSMPTPAISSLAGQVRESGCPTVANTSNEILLALPIHDGTRLRSVVCLSFR